MMKSVFAHRSYEANIENNVDQTRDIFSFLYRNSLFSLTIDFSQSNRTHIE